MGLVTREGVLVELRFTELTNTFFLNLCSIVYVYVYVYDGIALEGGGGSRRDCVMDDVYGRLHGVLGFGGIWGGGWERVLFVVSDGVFGTGSAVLRS